MNLVIFKTSMDTFSQLLFFHGTINSLIRTLNTMKLLKLVNKKRIYFFFFYKRSSKTFNTTALIVIFIPLISN